MIARRLPLAPGTLPGVMAAAVTLACAEFTRSGLYGAYLPQAATTLLHQPKHDAVAIAATAFTVHFMSDTLMRSPAGALISRYGIRTMMLAGAALSLAALGLLAAVHTGWMLLFVAALHGVGFSVMWPATMNLTSDSAHESHQGRALTVMSMSVMPLIGGGFLLMGALADNPPSLVFTLILSVLALSLLSALFVPRRLRHAHPGALGAAPTEAQAEAEAEVAPESGGHVRVALRALAPLIPAALLQTLTLTLLGPLLFTLAREMGVSYWQMVAVLAVGGAVAFGSMPFTGKIADSGRARLAVTLGFALLAVGMGIFATTPPLWALFLLAAVIGVGYAFIVPGWAALVVRRLPQQQRPAAWGALMTVENIGTSTGPLLGAFAYRLLGTSGPFIFGASMSALAAVGYVLFRHAFDQSPQPEAVPQKAAETPQPESTP